MNRFVRSALRAVAGTAVAALIVQAAQAAETPKNGGTLHLQANPWAGNFDPLRGPCGLCFVTGQVYASLTRLDADWNVVPFLATSWDISEDGLRYTFNLSDATFHDGKPVTSADVAFSVDKVKEFHRFGAQMLGGVDHVETPDPKTAVFVLSKPHAAVLLSTSTSYFVPIMPAHIYDVADYEKNPMHMTPLGSGPYKFTEFKEGEYVTLDRYENYFLEGKPYIDKLVFHLIRDANATKVAMERGEIQFIPMTDIPFRELGRMEDRGAVGVVDVGEPFGTLVYIGLNHRRAPFDNKLVRQAIAYSLDKAFLNETLHGGWTLRTKGPIQPQSPFYDDSVNGFDVDIERANALLDEAGLKKGANGVRFRTTLTHHPMELTTITAEYVTAQLAKVGIQVERQPPPDVASWLKRMQDWDFDMSIETLSAYPDPVIGVSRIFDCENIKHVPYTNVYGYCSPELDTMFAEAAQESNFEKRKALYSEIQEYTAEEQPHVWLMVRPLPQVHLTNLGNTHTSAWGALNPLDDLYFK